MDTTHARILGTLERRVQLWQITIHLVHLVEIQWTRWHLLSTTAGSLNLRHMILWQDLKVGEGFRPSQ